MTDSVWKQYVGELVCIQCKTALWMVQSENVHGENAPTPVETNGAPVVIPLVFPVKLVGITTGTVTFSMKMPNASEMECTMPYDQVVTIWRVVKGRSTVLA